MTSFMTNSSYDLNTGGWNFTRLLIELTGSLASRYCHLSLLHLIRKKKFNLQDILLTLNIKTLL